MRRPQEPFSAGEPGEARMAAERRAHRRELLAELLESEGWRQVLRPALLLKMERIATTLATDTMRSLEEIRGLQGQWRALAAVANSSVDDVGEE